MDKERLKRHIQKSDLTALEKRYLEKLVDAERGQWIPCSERLPKDGQEVLIITQKGKAVRFVRYNKTYNLFDIIGGFGTVGVFATSHWMPLPELPEDTP